MVGVDLACSCDAVGKDGMGAGWCGCGRTIDVMWSGVGTFGGSNMLTLSVQVSFNGGLKTGGCLRSDAEVRPGMDDKYPASMAVRRVLRAGEKSAAW